MRLARQAGIRKYNSFAQRNCCKSPEKVLATVPYFYRQGLFFGMLLLISHSANIGVERYLSPVSGRRATMTLPLFSGLFARTDAA